MSVYMMKSLRKLEKNIGKNDKNYEMGFIVKDSFLIQTNDILRC